MHKNVRNLFFSLKIPLFLIAFKLLQEFHLISCHLLKGSHELWRNSKSLSYFCYARFNAVAQNVQLRTKKEKKRRKQLGNCQTWLLQATLNQHGRSMPDIDIRQSYFIIYLFKIQYILVLVNISQSTRLN